MQCAGKEEMLQDITLLEEAARAAGAMALEYFRKPIKSWLKTGNSPVSEADLAVDNFLKELLLKGRPNYGWLSEETEDKRPAQRYQKFFVVDPIDGTRGFLAGDPRWCISIAVVEHRRPKTGILFCPALDKFYTAQYGEGAFLNGKPLYDVPSPAQQQTFQETSSLSSVQEDGVQGERSIKLAKMRTICPPSLANKLPQTLKQNMHFEAPIPSLAYRLALLAEGAIDVVCVRPHCCDWDIAAADLIVSESLRAQLVRAEGCLPEYLHAPYKHGVLFAAEKRCLQNILDIVGAANMV